jgi:hypothetical protein
MFLLRLLLLFLLRLLLRLLLSRRCVVARPLPR